MKSFLHRTSSLSCFWLLNQHINAQNVKKGNILAPFLLIKQNNPTVCVMN